MQQEKIIEIKNLTKKYKNIIAVNNLDLNVYKGDVFGFLGPNGAGKSTTIRMMLSLIKPTKGTIKIFDKELNENRIDILANIGSIVEKPDFYMYLSAYKNLEILGRISGADTSKKRIMELLEVVGLHKRYNSKVKTFSHGMKQRLGLAQALLHDPDLIVLDEPTTGLDPQGMKEIRDLIIYLSKEKGKTIFLSSHILSEVEIIANRMIIINKGSTQIEGEVKELLNSSSLKVKVTSIDNDNLRSVISESKWNEYVQSYNENELILQMSENEIPDLAKFLINNNVAINSIVPSKSLEEYFLSITQGNA